MVVLEIYSKCLKIQYKAYLCSTATIFTLLTILFSVCVSILLAYNSKGFWLKHDTFYEQPDVKFRGEFIISAVTQNISSPILCSNFPVLHEYSSLDRCSIIEAREIDSNNDKKVDELEFNVDILQSDSKIKSFDIILTLDYTFKTCPTVMQTAIVIRYILNEASSEISVIGNLGLTQTRPLACNVKYTNNLYDYSVIRDENDLDSYNVKNLILDYTNRHFSTHLQDLYVFSNIDSTAQELTVNVLVRYPNVLVYYSPGFWQVMKWAWIQFLILYITLSWFMRKIRNYVFENRLVLFYEQHPLKKMK